MIIKMKTNLIQLGIVLIFISGCKKDSKIDFERVIDMDITLQEKVFHEDSPNILTIQVSNTSDKKIVVPEGSFVLEFTSYSGSIRKTYFLDLSGDSPVLSEASPAPIEIQGNTGLTKSIDLRKLLTEVASVYGSELPVDDYTLNLLLDIKNDSPDSKNTQVIRSNYVDLQVEG
jgi:hypothetical protein